ncbi:acyl-CoA dehydrogenase family member 11-like [Branchiostoma lanceolatum]|uniref:acyl-CoA dehydrogenase family member 11-like n=1 Tax=Branchiostoma lanceolatum TaxID=7740 RepID=UPI003453F896
MLRLQQRGFLLRCCQPKTTTAVLSARDKSVWAEEAGHHRERNNVDLQSKIPFARAKVGPFFQDRPRLTNMYLEDVTLRSYLKRVMPKEVLQAITPDLERFGHRVATDIGDLGRECELNPPYLNQYDAWGRRTDEVVTCQAWRTLHDISAEEGIIAIPYEREFGQWSRLYQVAKLHMFNPASGLYSCPLAMTDGATKVAESVGDSVLLERAYPHLVSRNPAEFWTSGQWMTERRGGSDVANGTETLAVPQDDGTHRLYGYKWFSSATDADMTLTLARVMDHTGEVVQGTRGLSLFYLETRDSNGQLNNIQVQRLKNKLGTKQLPTGELLLDGAVAHKISDEGRGVAAIANMLTISRIHNSLMASGCARRLLNLARDYSTRRRVFGKLICEHPLHMQTLARLETETRGATLLVLEVGRLLGLQDCKMASEQDELMLRLITPITKLYTAKQAIAVCSEGLESFGGQGYIEDTGLPTFLRDAQVLSIWEGTTNVLSHDVLRSLVKTKGAVLQAFYSDTTTRLKQAAVKDNLRPSCQAVESALQKTMGFAQKAASQDPGILEVAARDFSYSLARIYIGVLMLEHASWDQASPTDSTAAVRWCQQDLCPVVTGDEAGYYGKEGVAQDTALVMEGYQGVSSAL